jgi:hypothetical protein
MHMMVFSRLRQILFLTLMMSFSSLCFSQQNRYWSFNLKSKGPCAFTISNRATAVPLEFSGDFSNCDSIVEISSNYPSSRIAIVDAAEERGGHVFVFHATDKRLHSIYLNYRSGDEDSLEAKLVGNTIILLTSRDELRIKIATNGSMSLISRHRE